MPEITIYTDGAASPNPGPGGYGVVMLSGSHRKEMSQGYQMTTNNRMELLAVVVGLEALKSESNITVFSDSQYVVESFNSGSVHKWSDKRWRRSVHAAVPNADIWRRLLVACARHKVTFEWVRGHSGNPENERCDKLAVTASKSEHLLEDVGYRPDKSVTTFAEPATKLPRESHVRHKTAGEPCRKCGTPLVKKDTKSKRRKPGQAHCFAWYLHCPGCKTMYTVEDAKRPVKTTHSQSLFDTDDFSEQDSMSHDTGVT
jgi:ribonuclease HI